MDAPKVTCLVPVFNTRADWLWIALKGLATQSYENLDVRVGDDGSTKASTLAILKRAQETWPERLFIHRRVENGGTAYALDEAMRHVDPETVYYSKADSDDIFHQDREKNRIKLFEQLPPQIGILYDNYLQLNYLPRPHIVPIILRPYDYRAYLDSSYIPGPSTWRASVYDKVPQTFVYEGYDGKANKHGEDLNHWLAITDHYDGFWYDTDPSYTWTYRFTGHSKYSSDKKGVDFARALLQQRAKERRGLA